MLTWVIHGMGESKARIAEVEKKWGIVFPPAYRAMLQEHSGGDSEELETMFMTDEILPMTDYPEYGCLRQWSQEDLAKVFPIFYSGQGDFYALDYSQGGEPGILDIDHELDDETPAPRYDSFDAFIEEIVQNAEAKREALNQLRPFFAR